MLVCTCTLKALLGKGDVRHDDEDDSVKPTRTYRDVRDQIETCVIKSVG